MKIPVYNIKGEKVKEVEVRLPKVTLTERKLSQVLRAYVTNIHQGTASAKTRGEVKHPDRKLWKQKGTGRARMGSRNSPIWVGGGVAHGPKPHQKRLKINKKERTMAFIYLLNEIVKHGNILLIEDVDTALKTKEAKDLMNSLGLLHRNVMAVFDVKDEFMNKAFRNLKKVLIRRAQLVSPYDLNRGYYLVLTESAWNILNDRLK